MISSHLEKYFLVWFLLWDRHGRNHAKEDSMKKTVFVALLLIIGITLAFPQPSYSCGPGWVIGAAAALVGVSLLSAAACPGYAYYGRPAGYAYPPPAYYYPPPAYGYRYPHYRPRYYPYYRYRGYYGPRHYGYYRYRW